LLTFEISKTYIIVLRLRTLLLIFILGFTIKAKTQTNSNCIEFQEINIPFDENAIKKDIPKEDAFKYNLVYYTENDKYSFWYKLNINKDCQLDLNILSANPTDEYDYLIYAYNGNDFCDAILKNNIKPLKKDSLLNVKVGQTYYVSVFNLYGDDCGHRLLINACNSSVVLNAVHKDCYYLTQFVNENTPKTDSVTYSGFIKDNEDNIYLDATITFTDEETNDIIQVNATKNEGYHVNLKQGNSYTIKCNAIGYNNKRTFIECKASAIYDFYMVKLKVGSNFVMENIYFYPNTYALKEESYSEIEKLAQFLTENPSIKIQILGHTAGDNPVLESNPAYRYLGDEWNFTGTAKKLSKLRAEAVMNHLNSLTIDKKRITTDGLGAEFPLIDNPRDEEERRKNMRVEIKIIERETKNITSKKAAKPNEFAKMPVGNKR
jgi:outer membrane protein OmpA-like peptidoglycan-associated protein